MYVAPCSRTSARNLDAEKRAGTIAAPEPSATAQPATTALEWKSGIEM